MHVFDQCLIRARRCVHEGQRLDIGINDKGKITFNRLQIIQMQRRARGRCIAGHWDFRRPNGKGDCGSFDIHFSQCFRMHFTEHRQHFLGA